MSLQDEFADAFENEDEFDFGFVEQRAEKGFGNFDALTGEVLPSERGEMVWPDEDGDYDPDYDEWWEGSDEGDEWL